MTIGERIKQGRKAKGLTQKQLGAISGTSEITIRQYELGKRQPRLEQLQRIADVLGTGLFHLLSGCDGYSPSSEDDAEFLASVAEGEFHTRMNTAFEGLSFMGKQEAAKRVEELAEIPRYRRQDTPAPHSGGATPEDE